MSWSILEGDVLQILPTLPAERFHCVVTSPPYWGLRDYQTGTWEGGLPDCDHAQEPPRFNGPKQTRAQVSGHASNAERNGRGTCHKCGAVRVDQQIGSEKTPEEYVAKMVEVFREVRRVLRADGVVWLNMGDCYNAYNGNRGYAVGLNKNHHEIMPALPTGHGLSCKSLKNKDLVGIPWLLAFALRADGWHLRAECIWCLSGGTRLYARTQKGEMPVTLNQLVRLDPATVKLWNGENWTQVLGWHRSLEPRDEAIELELRSGERIGCTPGHVWPTDRGNVRADELKEGDVILTTTLPEPVSPEIPECLGNEVAWLCGLYLAEGSMSGDTVQIAGHTKQSDERLSRLEATAKAFHGSVRVYADGNSGMICLDGPIIASVVRAYIHGNTARNKGIKVRAWRRDNGFLRSLLEGYLSGDGHYDSENDRWRLGFTRNDRLAADFRTIAARLDLPIRLAMCTVTGFGRNWPAYRGDIRLNRTTHHSTRRGGQVALIRRSRGRAFWDVEVEDEPHLFALASGVLTHNSKPNAMTESVTDRPSRCHEQVFLLTRKGRYFYDRVAVMEKATAGHGSGSKGRKPNHQPNGRSDQGINPPWDAEKRNLRSVWRIPTRPFKGAHFATFPPALAERCIKAGTSEHGCCPTCGAPWRRLIKKERVATRPGVNSKILTTDGDFLANANGQRLDADGPYTSHNGIIFGNRDPQRHVTRVVTIGWQPGCECGCEPVPCRVLDPFAGAGTTAMVAARLGRDSVGVELNAEYAAMARRRIADDMPLFNAVASEP